MSENTQLVLPNNLRELSQKLNGSILAVIGQDNLILFERAYLTSLAITELQTLLTPEYMQPIMSLQGNKLGFKTDKDASGGYTEAVVKNCLIEAVLTGVLPTGNHFNIIAGNTYYTKEGMGYLLDNMKGLKYKIIPQLPRINDKSAAVVMNIAWDHKGQTGSENIDFAIKVNNFMGTDAVIGKATRKARAWLFNTLNKTEIGDGDVADIQAEVLSSKVETNTEYERAMSFIDKATTLIELADIEKKSGPELLDQIRPALNEKRESILSMQP